MVGHVLKSFLFLLLLLFFEGFSIFQDEVTSEKPVKGGKVSHQLLFLVFKFEVKFDFVEFMIFLQFKNNICWARY